MNSFADVPVNARGHLGLLFYAAVHHVVYHLRRRASAAERSLDDVLREYPFLADYFSQIRGRLPEQIGWLESLGWLRQEIEAWENAAAVPLPISEMRQALGLPYEAALAFVLVGTVEEEAQFAALFASLQQPEGEHRVSVGLLQQVFDRQGSPEAWLLVRPLLEAGFLEAANRDAPRSEWALRVPTRLWNAARGESPESPFAATRYHTPDSLDPLASLVIGEELRAQLAELSSLAAAARTRAMVIRGMPGTDRAGVLGSVARELGRGLLEIECPASVLSTDERWRAVGPFCTLTHSMPVFSVDAGPGETFEVPALPGYPGPLGVMIGREGGIGGPASEHAITVQLDLEPPDHRLELWKRALNGQATPELSEIASTFCLPGRYIRQCARLALDYAAIARRGSVALPDVRSAARAINRQVLDTLAARIDGPATWPQLIVREATSRELGALEARCRHRERLAAAFAPSIPGGLNLGVRALFDGPSGTGKTLAARVLATELGLDLYRVDLAAVVNKYIGETEKNLSRVLSRAEDLNVILLLDEGDSLMTRRTEVKSANDRYANLETNYLLQRLESYTGIVVITTNAGNAIDSAFRRRMDCVVRFHLPDATERWRLWQVHLPAGHMVTPDALEEIALRYQLTGGQIRNICIDAALLALGEGDPAVHGMGLKHAIQSEHRKTGASFIDRAEPGPARNGQSLSAFLGGLS